MSVLTEVLAHVLDKHVRMHSSPLADPLSLPLFWFICGIFAPDTGFPPLHSPDSALESSFFVRQAFVMSLRFKFSFLLLQSSES